MQLFLIVLDAANADKVIEQTQNFSLMRDVHKVTEHAILVYSSASDPKVLTDLLGMTGDSDDEAQVGIVFRLNGSYSGLFYAQTWEWLMERRAEIMA